MITTVVLFKELERQRDLCQVAIDDLTPILKVSKVTYIEWTKGQIPDAHREPALREAVHLLHFARNEKLLPVKDISGEVVRPKTSGLKEIRQGILNSLREMIRGG